ncbi:MAG: FAD-dependent oxidoreductase, partial [Actinomycetota bacterium]|nr:FAD-dependent oxidoreductase [Actinomycetota bacterium]
MENVTVVGGGIGGLCAAIACAETNINVTLFEARSRLGGRARSTDGAFVANYGPHVLYDDGPFWRWLSDRGLAEPAAKAPLTGVRFRYGDKIHRVPPARLARVARLVQQGPVPTGLSGREWLTRERDATTAELATRLCHVFTFHHDPGSLSAAFVAERARRAFALPPAARYVEGGWSELAARLERHARNLGVNLVTETKIDELPNPPVVVALDLRAAGALLDDDALSWHGARTALLDIGLTTRHRDPFVLFDLDHGVFFERYSKPDPSLAPAGHELIQAQVGLDQHATIGEGVAHIEAALDAALPAWREREVWRRSVLVEDASGALDPPGTTWRDRPRVDRGNGVFLVGDMVAAPGLLSEV